ncbi:MAG: hypothetical protein DRJ03_01115 [Chloroflexi bacterium]|nr:MAG: hypothetical protein DRJ03_01115 [Chloroflexota bacterium]
MGEYEKHPNFMNWVSELGHHPSIILNYIVNNWKHFCEGDKHKQFFIMAPRITEQLCLSKSAFYKHRKTLENQNLIQVYRYGTRDYPYYQINFDHELLRNHDNYYSGPPETKGDSKRLRRRPKTKTKTKTNKLLSKESNIESSDSMNASLNKKDKKKKRVLVRRKPKRIKRTRVSTSQYETHAITLHDYWKTELGLSGHNEGSDNYYEGIRLATEAIKRHSLPKLQVAAALYKELFDQYMASRSRSMAGYKVTFREFFKYNHFVKQLITNNKRNRLRGQGSMMNICLKGKNKAYEIIIGVPNDPHPESTELVRRLYKEMFPSTNGTSQLPQYEAGFRKIVSNMQKLIRQYGSYMTYDASPKPKTYKMVVRFFRFLRHENFRQAKPPHYFASDSWTAQFVSWLYNEHLLDRPRRGRDARSN